MATVRAADLVVARLEEQVRELRAALEDAAEGICRVDGAGRIVSVNRAFLRLFGLTAEQAPGRMWEELLVEEDRLATRADLVAAVEKIERERTGVRSDGSTFPLQLSIVPVAGVPVAGVPGGRAAVTGHYLFIHDLSDRKRMENQLIFAGRMAAVGTLAAGVAHEINNPLAYIVANIDFARHQINTVASRLSRSAVAGGPAHVLDETGEALTEARQGAERVRNIVRDLRVFARGDDDQSGPVAVRRVLDSSINIAWNEIRHRARLVKDYGETPLVEGNESRLGQVFLNLLLNAAHAIPEGETERNEIRVTTRTDGRGYAIVEVRDSGMGIPVEIRERIFDPFFTTKPVGEGTGLGLWICHGIVSALGGDVKVDSEIGRGSTFRVTLPPALMDAPATFSTPTIPDVDAKGGRLLVVDDEAMILGALRRSLGTDYNVTCVGDGRRALERIKSGERFDVILCDLMMPELTGMDLHAELERIAPDQAGRMVFVSGGAFTPRAREFLERVPNARVEKPIDFQNLRVLLRNLSQ
ncbi:MAG TPA: ATP-binding protein [Polyangia bacterium]|nr:ATP-binding protein [Polyangia bacterium]